MKKNFNFSCKQKDFYNNDYIVNFITNEDGLRPFGNENKEGKKILILGDSFTMDPYASNNDMWYAILAKELSKNKTNYYGYAAGAGGYGTLQQFILLEKIKKNNSRYLYITILQQWLYEQSLWVGVTARKIINDIQLYHRGKQLWIWTMVINFNPHKSLLSVLKVTSKT